MAITGGITTPLTATAATAWPVAAVRGSTPAGGACAVILPCPGATPVKSMPACPVASVTTTAVDCGGLPSDTQPAFEPPQAPVLRTHTEAPDTGRPSRPVTRSVRCFFPPSPTCSASGVSATFAGTVGATAAEEDAPALDDTALCRGAPGPQPATSRQSATPMPAKAGKRTSNTPRTDRRR